MRSWWFYAAFRCVREHAFENAHSLLDQEAAFGGRTKTEREREENIMMRGTLYMTCHLWYDMSDAWRASCDVRCEMV